MDKDRVKGAMDDAAGRVKRQVGEWTGDKDAQAEGAAQQVKGKVEKAVGRAKDAVRDAMDQAHKDHPTENDIESDSAARDRNAA